MSTGVEKKNADMLCDNTLDLFNVLGKMDAAKLLGVEALAEAASLQYSSDKASAFPSTDFSQLLNFELYNYYAASLTIII